MRDFASLGNNLIDLALRVFHAIRAADKTAFLFDENEIVASYAAGALERLTGQDFGFPKCGPGACSFGEGVKNARRWWNDHKQDWKQ